MDWEKPRARSGKFRSLPNGAVAPAAPPLLECAAGSVVVYVR